MCDYCGRFSRHEPRCPLATPEYVYECDLCGGGIYSGETYMDIRGEYVCEKCVEEMTKHAE